MVPLDTTCAIARGARTNADQIPNTNTPHNIPRNFMFPLVFIDFISFGLLGHTTTVLTLEGNLGYLGDARPPQYLDITWEAIPEMVWLIQVFLRFYSLFVDP